ncbi:mechanosensitive ion channel [Desulfococcaceae bacterium HSG7]|nr:mechanosensitive ion channel [Desulfococcaceae bacterium HSG7]
MKSRVFFSLLIGLFLVVYTNPIYAQSDSDKGTTLPEEKTALNALLENLKGPISDEKLTKFEENFKGKKFFEKQLTAWNVLLENLKGRISDEKLMMLEENFKGKEFSEKQLDAILLTLNFTAIENKVILANVRSYFEFMEKIRKGGPIILSANTIKKAILIKKKERESVHKGKEKIKISRAIEALDGHLKNIEIDFEVHTATISEGNLRQLPVILEDLGYDAEKTTIILRYIEGQVEFVKKIKTLETIIRSIDEIKEAIVEKEKERENAQSEEEKEKMSENLKRMRERLKKLEYDFAMVTTGIDLKSLYDKGEEKEVSWDKELEDIFSPIIVELKEITSLPREMEMLRSKIAYYEKRIPQIKQGIKHIEEFMKDVEDAATWTRLKESHDFWKQQEKEFVAKLETAQHRLFELDKGRKSLSESVDYFFEFVQYFLKDRGNNILLAIAAFFLIYLMCSILRHLLMIINPFNYIAKYKFLASFVDVLLYFFTFIASTTAMVLVLYIRGDWLVLAIVIIMLSGIGWAMKNTLPQFTEQIKLILNIGPIRLQEKVLYDGVPYRVESIGIYSYLKNPLLTGGTLRLPLKDLIGMRSRSWGKNEPWFPCKEGDYVLINGSTWRHVILQTPQIVKFEWFEMYESMPTDTFMSQKIFNLSEAPYWVGFGFEVAYKHRFDILDEICQKLTLMTKEEVKKVSWSEFVINPWIDFENFGDSSLIITYWIQMKKEAASQYPTVKRALRKIALKAANKYDLEIIRFEHIHHTNPDEAGTLLEKSVSKG